MRESSRDGARHVSALSRRPPKEASLDSDVLERTKTCRTTLDTSGIGYSWTSRSQIRNSVSKMLLCKLTKLFCQEEQEKVLFSRWTKAPKDSILAISVWCMTKSKKKLKIHKYFWQRSVVFTLCYWEYSVWRQRLILKLTWSAGEVNIWSQYRPTDCRLRKPHGSAYWLNQFLFLHPAKTQLPLRAGCNLEVQKKTNVNFLKLCYVAFKDKIGESKNNS